MHIWVGIDVAKQVHWATAVDEAGEVRIDRAVPNSPAAIEALIADLKALNGEVVIGLDVIGGIAGLVTAMLAAAGFRLVHVPGLAVNRARQATTGGETKSDSKDARVIADQLRLRRDFRAYITVAMAEKKVWRRQLISRPSHPRPAPFVRIRGRRELAKACP